MGTQFDPTTAKRGNEELENWLLRLLSPRIDFRFFEVTLPEGRVVVLEIARAFPHPVKFSGEERQGPSNCNCARQSLGEEKAM